MNKERSNEPHEEGCQGTRLRILVPPAGKDEISITGPRDEGHHTPPRAGGDKARLGQEERIAAMTEWEEKWNALTPQQKQAVVICHRAAKQIQQMRREAQTLMAELEEIARCLDHGQRSREVAETLARRFGELYTAIQALGEEHHREEDFFRYADDYGQDLGLWGPLP